MQVIREIRPRRSRQPSPESGGVGAADLDAVRGGVLRTVAVEVQDADRVRVHHAGTVALVSVPVRVSDVEALTSLRVVYEVVVEDRVTLDEAAGTGVFAVAGRVALGHDAGEA